MALLDACEDRCRWHSNKPIVKIVQTPQSCPLSVIAANLATSRARAVTALGSIGCDVCASTMTTIGFAAKRAITWSPLNGNDGAPKNKRAGFLHTAAALNERRYVPDYSAYVDSLLNPWTEGAALSNLAHYAPLGHRRQG